MGSLDVVNEVLLEFQQLSNLKVSSYNSWVIPLGPNVDSHPKLEEEQTFPLNFEGRFFY